MTATVNHNHYFFTVFALKIIVREQFGDELRVFNLTSSERHSEESVDRFIADKTNQLCIHKTR